MPAASSAAGMERRDAMKAVLLTGHGGPEALVYRGDIPTPEPAEDEVLVKVGAAGVNNTDLWTREGAYGSGGDPRATGGWRRDRPMEFPRIQGIDIAGRIVATGAEVPEARVGERVLVNPVIYPGGGEEGLAEAELVGSERDGGFAEYVAVPARNAHAVETSLTDEELATFPTAYLTAERMLNRARLEAGEAILVTGASGGVGSALLQLAGVRGAHTIAMVGAGKEERARELGAEAVITRGTGDLSDMVRQGTESRTVDVAGRRGRRRHLHRAAERPQTLRTVRDRRCNRRPASGPGSPDPVSQAARADRLYGRYQGGVRRTRQVHITGRDKTYAVRLLPALPDTRGAADLRG